MSDTFVLRRGLSDIYAAVVTADTDSAYTAGVPFKLIPAGELSITVDGDSTIIWYDNTPFATIGREGSSELSITGAGLRAAARAALNDKHVDAATGAIIDDGEWHEKYLAVGGKMDNTDGTSSLFWFLKGTFAIPDESGKTEDDSTDTNGDELTYTAIKTKHQFEYATNDERSCKRVVVDTGVSRLVANASWTEQVVTPDNLADIVELISDTPVTPDTPDTP